jgi:transglutaminase-like putative cysteine protease/predicted glutamine amidotransferase
MSELVALSFDANASPSASFETPDRSEAAARSEIPAAAFGWGVGWYPSSERGASVVKDPTSSGQKSNGAGISDWHRFVSTTFIFHLRGHRRPRKQQDAQPFVRSYGGHQWIFAHDGDLAKDWATRFALPDDPSFEPLGRTDSEHAFCWLLARMHSRRFRSISEVPPEEFKSWMHELSFAGQLNLLLSDGENLIAFHDPTGQGSLHVTRRVPPHVSTEMRSDAVQIKVEAPEDANRTALVISSVPLTPDGWRPMLAGELLVARQGVILYSSAFEDPTLVSHRPDPSVVLPAGQVEIGSQPAAAQPLNVPSQTQTQSAGRAIAPVSVRTLSVVHHTRYEYSSPVERSSHRILLRPLEDRNQELLSQSLEIEPSVALTEYEDVFGNAAVAVDFSEPFSQLDVTCRTTVRVHAFPPIERRARPGRNTIPMAWMPWQRQMLSAYLMPPELPETQLQELSRFAMGFVERNDYDLVGTLLEMNKTIFDDFEYVSGSTTNETTAFQVFESRRGVCQDFANLMICLARLLQVPARYRMGYIFTGTDYENQIQSDASHAWLEVYVPRVGWHGFDPTNGIQVGADHVRVACGRSYLDATPTTGTIYRGGGTETLTISVRVEEIDPVD